MTPIPGVPDEIDPALAEEIREGCNDRHRIAVERVITQFGLDEAESQCAAEIALVVKASTTIETVGVDPIFATNTLIRMLAWGADNNFSLQPSPEQWAEWGITDSALILAMVSAARVQLAFHSKTGDQLVRYRFPGHGKRGTDRARRIKLAALILMREVMETEDELSDRFGRPNVARALMGNTPAEGGQL